MMAAAKEGSAPICRILLSAHADAHLKNKDGWTALHVSARTGDVELFNLLRNQAPETLTIRATNGRSILNTLALHGHSRILSQLLDGDTSLVEFAHANFVLQDAASSNDSFMIKSLRPFFASCDWLEKDGSGLSPLHAASQVSHLHV